MRAVVTGGGGFVGRAIVERLVERGDGVRIIARGNYPDLARVGVECIRGDVADFATVRSAVEGADVVFHAAAKVGYWGQPADFERANVLGTCNIVQACQDGGVRRLVHTSTPAVVAQQRPLEGLDETVPYPAVTLCEYQRTKIIAEKAVLAANGRGGLATIALRPHNIWGPGDPHFIPRLAQRARGRRLNQIGDGRNRVDVTYIDNAAEAHLLAADKLRAGAAVGGRAYFVSQGEPVLLWPFFNRMLKGLDLPLFAKRVPYSLARNLGQALEAIYRILPQLGEPPLTRFLAVQLGESHYFDISRVRADLGYAPRIGIEEGLERTFAHYRTHSPL